MKNILITPVGKDMSSLFLGLKEFSIENVILITLKEEMGDANKVKEDLDKFKINSKIIELKGNVWEAAFKIISETKMNYKDKEVIINVGPGDKNLRCAIISAAFVNGLKAYTIDDDKIINLPILRFSYYRILTDRKMEIIKLIYDSENHDMNLETISQKTKMSLPLISYHINGNLKSEGLKELGLVTSREEKGKSYIKISNLGKLLIKGYVKQA